MNRPLKFRAWDEIGRSMWSGFELNESCFVYPPDVTYPPEKRLIFMQYTGLADSNGVKVYEGDILSYDFVVRRVKDNWEQTFTRSGVVELGLYDPGDGYEVSPSYGWLWDGEPLTQYTFVKSEYQNPLWKFKGGTLTPVVVGNIYESPELLEQVA